MSLPVSRRGDQPVVRRNEWDVLAPPAVGAWTPTRTVTVVVPADNTGRTQPHVLAGLAAQTYPAHLLEVVVSDDGSTPPVELPEVVPDNTRVVRVEQGWGCAGACEVAGRASEGELLHFVDADMLLWPDHLEAQLRWLHEVDYAVVAGTKRFVDPDRLLDQDPATTRAQVASGEVATLWDWDEAEPHKWVEGMWRRTDDLTQAGPRAFRSFVGATFALSRDLLDAAGGWDTTMRLGEDMELGHRLGEAGGVLVPEHAARSWHLGRSHVMERREQVNRYNDAYLANLVPGMRPKRNAHGRRYETPYLEVVLAMTSGEGAADEVMRCVDAVLDSSLDDLRVLLLGDWAALHEERVHPLADPLLETRIVHRSYRDDQRVALVAEVPAGRTRSSLRLTLDSPASAPAPGALLALVEDLERTHDGAVVIEGVGRLERVAALSRATWLGLGTSDEALDRVYGVRRLAAADAGFVATAEREVPRYDGKLKKPVPSELGAAADVPTDPESPAAPIAPADPDVAGQHPGRRGIWGRLR
jgi:GT2 family glycosyltransferase